MTDHASHESVMQKSFTSINLIKIKFARMIFEFWGPYSVVTKTTTFLH